MKEIPKMYQNDIKKTFNNNRILFRSSNTKSDKKNIRKEIIKILNDNDFIYRRMVKIVINNQILEKKIIGISGNNLVTINNEYIDIDKIEDIYK